MSKQKKIRAAQVAVFVAVPLILLAHSSGPSARSTGAPGDAPQACTQSGCHVGTALNGGGGNVTVSFDGGNTYTPGTRKRITVTVTDSTARRYGFQATARLVSNLSGGQAGTFVPGTNQQVICDDDNLRPSAGCRASVPVEFIEHRTPLTSNVITFDWDPPSSNVGDVRIYVAANAANGDGNNTGDKIYTTNATLTFQGSAANPPSINSGGIVTPLGFGGGQRFSVGQWIEIYGANISNVQYREWAGGDFNGNTAPTSLDGISATVGGVAAPIWIYTTNQVNIQIPQVPAGPQQVVIRTPNGQTAAQTITVADVSPALIINSAFKQGDKQYAVLQSGTTYIAPAGLIPGATTRPARPGETLVLYGIGFGNVNPAIAPGQITTAANSIARPVSITFTPAAGGTATPATLAYQGLAGNFVGLYQFNLVVPQLADGEYIIKVSVGGVEVPQTLLVPIAR
jgi:uncharacterized protein (TIGR03437 family)